MRIASRLGDGLLWYLLLAALPLLYGAAAIRPALIMMATGLAGLLIYRRLKSVLVRERPFIRYPGITQAMAMTWLGLAPRCSTDRQSVKMPRLMT